MDELTRTTTEIKSMLAALDQKMDRRFDALEARFETRFASLETRFDARFTSVEGRFTGVESRFTAVETRFNQWFLSIVGLQAMTLLAIVAGLFGIVTKLL